MKIKEIYLSLIKEGKKKNISEIDIRFLLSYYNNFSDASSFYLLLDKECKNIDLIKKGFSRLEQGVPLAYITHETYFLSHKYFVDKSTLIPRVETEELVSLAIKYLSKIEDKKLKVLDIGTGSGVIAIELATRFSNLEVYATDINIDALKVAKKNAKKYHANIKFFNADTFPKNKIKFDVIISNPPYIKYKKDVDKSVLDYEPHNALFISKENNVYEKVLSNLNRISLPCFMIFEIDPSLEKDLTNLINKKLGKYNLSYIFSKDINKKTRFLSILLNQ